MADQTYKWITAGGAEYDLSSSTYTVLAGVTGLMLPGMLYQVDSYFDHRQAYRQSVQSRDIDLPILITGSTKVALDANIRALANALITSNVATPGKLRVTRRDGTARDIYCYYVGGFFGTESADEKGTDWYKVSVTLRAYDPYFLATTNVTASYASGTPVAFFPFFPLQVNSGTVFGNVNINNNGDVEAWPIWTIVGPGTNPTVTHNGTGETIALTLTLVGGDTLVIDTRPGKKTIVKNGVSVYSTISAASVMFPIYVGGNVVEVLLGGASGASSVSIQFTERFRAL